MGITASAILSEGIDSYDTGLDIGRRTLEAMGSERPAVLLLYASVIHEQQALLQGLRTAIGPEIPFVGCSTQGIVGRDFFVEDGYAAGAMALGGPSIRACTARQDDIHIEPRNKGAALGRSLMARLSERPKIVIPHYDPLCGADVDLFLAGLFEEVRCPIIGAAASQPYSAPVGTFQYYGESLFSHGAVATALCGEWRLETDICHGASPMGVEVTVTKVEGPKLLALDGRPALDVWEEITTSGPASPDYHGYLALGLPNEDPDGEPYLVRSGYGIDRERGGVILPLAVSLGTKIMLHYRTTDGVLQGTARMAKRLKARLSGKAVRAILGFECGARTKPFLGAELTRQENCEFQAAVPEGAWLGMLPWGEVYATTGRPVFHNYAYPVVVLAD